MSQRADIPRSVKRLPGVLLDFVRAMMLDGVRKV